MKEERGEESMRELGELRCRWSSLQIRLIPRSTWDDCTAKDSLDQQLELGYVEYHRRLDVERP